MGRGKGEKKKIGKCSVEMGMVSKKEITVISEVRHSSFLIQDEIGILKKGFEELKIVASDEALNKFKNYLKILYEYRNRFHLISHRDYTRIAIKHFLPSLLILKFLANERCACDIGAGAGFPSIPVKILKPEIDFTLFESVKKKADFLKDLINRLELSGIEVVAQRAENYKEKKFDLILIRAAGKIRELLNTIDILLAAEGSAIFYKKADIEKELKQAEKQLHRRNFSLNIERIYTPIEKLPVSLVFLRRKCSPL